MVHGVYGLWSMVYGLWSMVYGLWSMVYGLWSLVYGLWSMVYCLCLWYGQWSMVNGLQSMVHGLWSMDIRQFTVSSVLQSRSALCGRRALSRRSIDSSWSDPALFLLRPLLSYPSTTAPSTIAP